MANRAKDPNIKHKKPKPPPKKTAAQQYETKEYNKLKGQVESDIKKEKGESPGQVLQTSKQVSKDLKAEQALEAAGMGHPDAEALIAAGISPNRVQQLANIHAPSHPAADPNAGIGFTANPTSPAQYAADVLKDAGLPDTASNEKLLETQMTVEGMPGSENNPLATSLAMAGSSAVNSDSVQQYPSLAEGAEAEAATLEQPNMSSIYGALKPGTDTASQYATALANSSYEGSSPSANAAYANSYLTDAGQPEQNFPGGGAAGYVPTTGAQSLADASSQNLFGNLTGAIPMLGSQGASQSLSQALSGLTSSPEAATEEANTTQAPGSPDQSTSTTQKTNVAPATNYQTILAALLPGVTPGTAGKNG